MKNTLTDWKLLIGYLIAHVLIYFTFDHTKVFWYFLAGTSLFLISYAIINEELEDRVPLIKYLLYGAFSGIVIYGLFWIGYALIDWMNLKQLVAQVSKIYSKLAPKDVWHYIVLILIAVPAEEIFWRGFIQKRLLNHTNFWTSVLLSSILYASVYVFTGYFVLILAALVSGIFWGYLYAKKRSMPLVIISHLTFDLLLLVSFPLV